MTNRDPLGWRVDPEVREEFREFVSDKHGKTHGKLGEELETAMREYMDDTRLSRMERKLDDIQATLSEESGTHTRDTCKPQSPTAEKVADIVAAIESDINPEIDLVVDGDLVTRAIESVAGADDRTLAKYRTQLKRRGELYQHPTDENTWYRDRDIWIRKAYTYVDNSPRASLGDVIDPYPLDHDEFIDAVERLDVYTGETA